MPKLNSLNQSVRDPDLPTWTCQICGKTDLNYKEATDCEQVDQRQLQPFSTGLMKALLFIVNRIKSPSFQDLTNLIHTYAYNRLFPSELVHYTLPNSSETRIGIVEKVECDKKKFPEPPLIHPEAEDLAYCVVDYELRRKVPKQIMVLPASFCRRRNFSLLNKEKIRFFIRRTCEIRDDFYKPKDMFLEKVQLPPYTKSAVSWSDFSVDPEPNWSQILCMLYRNEKSLLVKAKQGTFVNVDSQQINQRKQQLPEMQRIVTSTKSQSTSQSYSDFKEFLNRTSFVEIRDEFGNLCSESSGKSSTISPAFDQRNYRQEFYDLAREWSNMVPRDDLRLADLVPLPENLTPIKTRLPPIEFGMALQLIEFYHAFGHHLNIPCPKIISDSDNYLRRDQSNITGEIERSDLVNPVFIGGKTKMLKVETGVGLSLPVLELALIDKDPAGPLADLFIGLLKVIRTLENEVNSKPPSGPAQNASQVANAAVGHVSIGFGLCNPQNAANPITLSGMLNPYANSQGNSNATMCNNDYAAALTEIAQSDGGVLARAFRHAGFAALLNEMCGLPAQLASGKAGKAAIACAQQIQNHEEAEDTQDSTSLLLSVAKSAGAASASGTLSEVPLDRCTLNQVLWLHIVTSVAKGGGFRGNIWGGTRILDDPVLGLVRSRPLLVQKLLKTSLFDLTPHEKLVLLITLVDELLIQPQVREAIEENFDRIRSLRQMLKNQHQYRSKLHNCGLTVSDEQAHALLSAGIAPNLSTEEFLNTSVKSRVGGSSKKNLLLRPIRVNNISLEPLRCIDFAKFDLTDSDLEQEQSLEPSVLDEREEEMYESILQLSRGCSMLPLGMDRCHRRYWLVLSLPAFLVEDAGPDSPHCTPLIEDEASLQQSRQLLEVSNTQIEPDFRMGQNAEESLARIKALVAEQSSSYHPNSRIVELFQSIQEQESLMTKASATFPSHSNDGVTSTILNDLLNPKKVCESTAREHRQNPAVAQVDRLSKNQVHWSIFSPDSAGDEAACTHQLELLIAALNPRGRRESCLRRSLIHYKDLIVKVMQQTPNEYLIHGPDKQEETRTCDADQVCGRWTLRMIDQMIVRMGFKLGDFQPHRMNLTTVKVKTSIDNIFSQDSDREAFLDKFQQIIGSLNNVNLDKYLKPQVETSESLDAEVLLKLVVVKLLYLCVRLDPRALCGPISVEDKNMRVGMASLFDLSDHALSLGMPPTHEDDEKLVTLLSTKCSQQTNGVQRWVVSVLRATNLSQLNLLAAAFERSARRATNGGRGVPAFIVGVAMSHPLPRIVCSICKGGPDHAPSSQSGPQANFSPFSRCSTCLSPCHLACLVDSRNGQLSRAKRKPNVKSKMVFEPDLAGHFSLTSSLASQIHSRLDASGAAFLICDPCKVLAGFNQFADSHTLSLVDVSPDEDENVSDVENIPDSSDSEDASPKRALSPSASPPTIKVTPRLPGQADQKVNLLKAISLAALKEKATPKSETTPRRKPGRPPKSVKIQSPEPSPARRATEKLPKKRKMTPEEEEPVPVVSLKEDPNQALVLLHDLIALPAAKPLKGCGISRSIKAEEESPEEEEEKPKLLVNDLNDLVFMADKNILPGGPLQIIPQLKLLLSRWSQENRPGSRLHGCVMELREQLDKRLQMYGYEEAKSASLYKRRRKSALPSPAKS